MISRRFSRQNAHARQNSSSSFSAARFRCLDFQKLESRQLLASDLVITEFMAKNDGFFRDGDDKSPDWIEIQNISDQTIDLAGYHLTDTRQNLTRWTFPNVEIESGRFMVVFASGKTEGNYVDAGGFLHTNFSLGSGGEYVALVAPDGTVLSEFGENGSNYPPQASNLSYGIAQESVFLDETSSVRYWVPTNGDVDRIWKQIDFNAEDNGFAVGEAALGYESDPDSRNNFSETIKTELPDNPHAVYARVEFELQNTADVKQLTLKMKYENGFVAYLNGTKVAEANAPVVTTWESNATSLRSDRRALQFEDFDISEHISRLASGKNVLALHGLNFASDRKDMLLVPELVASLTTDSAEKGFISEPTPGAGNPSEHRVFEGLTLKPNISVQAGFFDAPFAVELNSETPNAEIRYTTDGSKPTTANSTVYTTPVEVTTTTTLRAATFLSNHVPSKVATSTYLFLDDVIRQSNEQPGLPTRWQQPGIGFDADYEMDQEIVDNPAYRDEIIDGLKSIPSMSITMHPEDFLGPDGIYINTAQHGAESERAVSVELIEPDGSLGFQVDAGLRNSGNRTRDFDVTLKQSFRLVFRTEHGPSKLKYPLFPDSPAERFDNIVLHAGKLLDDPQLVRNSFGRDTNRDMGNAGAHSTYVHLYLNGLYWGLYNPFERPDARFAEEYFGGDDSDYDSILNNTEVIDGDRQRYNSAWRLLRSDLPTKQEFEEFKKQINLNSLFDLLLVNQYMAHDEHELRSIGNRSGDADFRFFIQDVDEGGMMSVRARMTMDEFLPGDNYRRLTRNAETRMVYADRIHKHLFNGGALTPEAAAARWEARTQQIHSAVIAETARWGDTHWRSVFPRRTVERDVNMKREHDFLTERFFPERTQAIIDQLRRSNIYPDINAPTFNQFGGNVSPGFNLVLEHENENGAIVYTVDGSDPREFGGAPSQNSLIYDGAPIPITEKAVIKARVLSDGEWSALTEAEFALLSGDIDGDGQISASDIDAFCARINDGDMSLDLDQDGVASYDDTVFFIRSVLGTDLGDANLDGVFDSNDLNIREFEDGIDGNSTWADGDFNCDGDFTSADLVIAFETGLFRSVFPF